MIYRPTWSVWFASAALAALGCAGRGAPRSTAMADSSLSAPPGADSGVHDTSPVTALDSSPPPECSADSQCKTGFCDRGRCDTPADLYGQRCSPAPIGPDGLRDPRQHACGAYLCIDERCRSCTSDEECLTELGSPRCVARPPRPGLRCGSD